MPPAGFEKISHSNVTLYGPRKLLLCGFPAGAQSKFATLLGMIGLRHIDLVWASTDHSNQSMADLIREPDGYGEGVSSSLPRAVIASGITEKELHLLMSGCRKARMQNALWATLTPTSETWTLGALLAELSAEHQAMSRKNQTRHGS
jgi:hypothetical protein